SDKVGAIEMFRAVMDTHRFMTKAERKAKIFLHLGWQTVQFASDELMKQFKVILKSLEIDMSEVVGPLPAGELDAAANTQSGDGSPIDENDRVGKVSIAAFGKLVEEILGRVCDVCKTERRKGYEGNPGFEFKEKDLVALKDLSVESLNGKSGEIVGMAAPNECFDGETRWAVKLKDSDKTVSVKACKLTLTRPVEYDAYIETIQPRRIYQ
ncbi:hypothetical protein HDU76_007757, partial [Blyttiomyces sp. JEL0837]